MGKKETQGKLSRLDGIAVTNDTPAVITMPDSRTKTRRGRPSLKTPELLDEICIRIMNGLNIVEVCEADDMPHRDTVHAWLASDSNFSDKYARACKIRREGKFYEMERIARTEEDVTRARLINDTLKWQLSKEEPKKYGDKLDVTSDGKALPTPLLGGVTIDPPKEQQ